MRSDLTFEMPPGRIASSTSSTRRVADRLPGREALAQAQVGDVAVAVVRRLRQDGEDELGDRVAVRRQRRDAVDLAQALADARDAVGAPARPPRPAHASAPQRSARLAAAPATASGSAAAPSAAG